MENPRIKTVSTEWQDRLVGYHEWQGVSECPSCGRRFPDTLYTTEQGAKDWNGECPTCEAEDE